MLILYMSGRSEKGALLRTYSVIDGKMLAEYELESPPIFDGLIAANRRLYLIIREWNYSKCRLQSLI